MQIKTKDALMCYIHSKHIDLNDYKFKEENNKFGIRDVEPIKNPYLWNHLISNQHDEAIEYLLEYGDDIINPNIITALFQSRNDNGLNTSRVTKLLDLTYKNKSNPNSDALLLGIIGLGKFKILRLALKYLAEHEIELNPNGAFIRGALAEAAKIGDKRMIDLILEQYPITLEKSDNWPLLNCLKKGFYSLAKFFANKGLDIHAKNDLGYKLMERNYKKNAEPATTEEREAHDWLMDIYHIEKKAK